MEKKSHASLKDLEIGAMFWAGRDPLETLREVKSRSAYRCGQLGVPGDMPLEGAAEAWSNALKQENFTIVTVFCAYIGRELCRHPDRRADGRLHPESYASRTRAAHQRREPLCRGNRSQEHRVPRGICSGRQERSGVHSRRIWSGGSATTPRCTSKRSRMETGQERAEILLEFLKDVDRKNLGINFDPANLIMYGQGIRSRP